MMTLWIVIGALFMTGIGHQVHLQGIGTHPG